jgi:D-amino peptidase
MRRSVARVRINVCHRHIQICYPDIRERQRRALNRIGAPMRVFWFGMFVALIAGPAAAQRPARIFISVDMEGIGGVGSPAMTSTGGKDYETARRFMTQEVNAVVKAIFDAGPAEIVVNDSHGDHQNVLHGDLDPRVQYIQGAVKPLGMVAGLDSTFDGMIFLGYHARAGARGFLAHTGSGIVKGLWINGVEVGEGGMNLAYANAVGVPLILAAGDSAFTEEIRVLAPGAQLVATKVAVTPQSARLLHPQVVRERLAAAAQRAVAGLASARPGQTNTPVSVRLRFDDVTRSQILEAIPGVRSIDGYTVTFTAPTADEAVRLIRFMYRFVSL